MTSFDAASKDADTSLDHAKKAVNSAKDALDSGRRALPEISKEARRIVGEGVTDLKDRSKDAAGTANEKLEDARLYVTDQVQERPITATFAALGVGFVLGVLFSGRR